MFHRFFSINHTSAGSNYTAMCLNLTVHSVLYLYKSVGTVFLNKLTQQFSFCFLDQQICIHKLISKSFCQYDTNRTFSNTRHTDQNNIISIHFSTYTFSCAKQKRTVLSALYFSSFYSAVALLLSEADGMVNRLSKATFDHSLSFTLISISFL